MHPNRYSRLSSCASPAPKEEDLAKGILEAIDMDSYRVEKKAVMKIALEDADAEIEPRADRWRRP